VTTVTDTGQPAWYPPERVARYYDLGLWTGEVLTDLVRRNAERDPHGLCVADGRRVLTFADALEESERLAGSLAALGIGAGDRVVVQLPNWWEAVISYYAIGRLGAVFVPRMTIYRESEIRDAADRSGARAIIVPGTFRRFDHAGMAASVREQVDSVEHVVVAGPPPDGTLGFADLLAGAPYGGPWPEPGDRHVILFTSGTTSRPKGAQHSFNTFSACARTMRLGLGGGARILGIDAYEFRAPTFDHDVSLRITADPVGGSRLQRPAGTLRSHDKRRGGPLGDTAGGVTGKSVLGGHLLPLLSVHVALVRPRLVARSLLSSAQTHRY